MGQSICFRSEERCFSEVFLDYRQLNHEKVADTYPLPLMEYFIDILGALVVFSTLYANLGYLKIPISEEDLDKTCFTNHIGIYRYKLMPFGLLNVAATFQISSYINLSEFAGTFS